MTLEELRDRLIEDGIAEVTAVYDPGDERRAGALEGFDLCRTLQSRDDYDVILAARQRREMRKACEGGPLDGYWRHRYATLQVEWILACLIAAGWRRDGDLISGRAIMKVASIVGVRAA